MKTIFKLILVAYSICILFITAAICNWQPSTGIGFAATFLLLYWIFLRNIYLQINWVDKYDYGLAMTVEVFLGSVIAFMVPGFFGLEAAVEWNMWSQIHVIIFLIALLIGMIIVYLSSRRTMGIWKWFILLFFLLVSLLLFLSVKGIF